MGNRGNTAIIIILVVAVAFSLFMSVPLGGSVGLLREATISFIFRKPPRFISLEVYVNGSPKIIQPGESLHIQGRETLIITKVNANTFFDSYLTVDVVGFGKANDLHEPIDTDEIRKQIISAGIRSVPIDVYYINHNIARVPLEIELTEEDFLLRIEEARSADDKIAILRTAHANFPENTRFLEMLETLLSDKEDYQALVSLYRAVVTREPDNITAYANLSRYYIRLGMMQEALEMSKQIVEKGNPTAVTYRRMAYIAGQQGDFNNRVDYLRKALELDKGNDSIIIDLAKTYEQAGRKGEALEIFRSAAGSARDKEILIPVIDDALNKKKYKEASSLLQRYVEYYPDDKNAYAHLGMVMGVLGDTKSQISYYRKAAELSPKDPVVLYNLGIAYEKAGNLKSALSAFQQVLQVKKSDQDSLIRAAGISLRLNQFKSAYDYYQALIKTSGKTEYYKGLVSAAVGMKDHDRIIDACTLYLKKNKDHDVAITMAYAYEARAAQREGRDRLSDLNAALEAYTLALKLNPNSKVPKEKIPELRIETIRLRKGFSMIDLYPGADSVVSRRDSWTEDLPSETFTAA
ncbi:MAG: tetratricopeptide repeat protein [Desulfomonilia bacterium]|nr:tetratricopeptide repeat protein [Desulfomonilia bacterium]